MLPIRNVDTFCRRESRSTECWQRKHLSVLDGPTGGVDSGVMCCVVQSVLSHTAGCSAASGIRHAHPLGLPRPEEARRGGGSGGLCQGHRSLCRETQQQGRHLVGSMERDGEDFHPCEYDLSVKWPCCLSLCTVDLGKGSVVLWMFLTGVLRAL